MKHWLIVVSMLLWSCLVQASEVKVAAASNFAAPFKQIAERFRIKTGHTTVVTLGSTGALYAQIMNGIPYELFLSADTDRPNILIKQGRAVAGTRQTYAIGHLVLWSNNSSFVDAHGRLLQTRFNGRLAIANPVTSPYGQAAQQTLEHLGQWHNVQKGLVRGENIAQTFQFASSGSVDVAFIALSQIKSGDLAGKGSYWLVPETLHEPIEQQMVLLEKGKHSQAAKALMEFIASSEGRRIISAAGYGEWK